MTIQNETDWRPEPVTNKQIRFATVLCFLAWAFAVYDFILFGTLLPEIGEDLGLDTAEQATLVTWMSIGAVALGLLAGPVVDKFGRKAGLAFTTAGAGIASALTALAAFVPAPVLVGIRSLSGLGLSEQGSTARTSASCTEPPTTRGSRSARGSSTPWCRAAGRSGRSSPPG